MDPSPSTPTIVAFQRDLFRLLSALLLCPPTEEGVRALADPETRTVLASVIGEGAAPVERLAGVELSADLVQEFHDLLRVPTSRYVVPFESVYCDTREVDGVPVGGLLAGPSAEAVRRAYARAGFELAVPELPDHAGCELAFLAELLSRAVDSFHREDPDAAQAHLATAAQFARAHPARWLPRLAARMTDDPRAVFYPAAVALGAGLAQRMAEGPQAG